MAIIDETLRTLCQEQPQQIFGVIIAMSEPEYENNFVMLRLRKLRPIAGYDGWYKGPLTGEEMLEIAHYQEIDSIEIDDQTRILEVLH